MARGGLGSLSVRFPFRAVCCCAVNPFVSSVLRHRKRGCERSAQRGAAFLPRRSTSIPTVKVCVQHCWPVQAPNSRKQCHRNPGAHTPRSACASLPESLSPRARASAWSTRFCSRMNIWVKAGDFLLALQLPHRIRLSVLLAADALALSSYSSCCVLHCALSTTPLYRRCETMR